MLREWIEKKKSIKKMIKKITIKIIGTEFDIKIKWEEMLKNWIEEGQIYQENNWKTNSN
jgi:hypothetical protein